MPNETEEPETSEVTRERGPRQMLEDRASQGPFAQDMRRTQGEIVSRTPRTWDTKDTECLETVYPLETACLINRVPEDPIPGTLFQSDKVYFATRGPGPGAWTPHAVD